MNNTTHQMTTQCPNIACPCASCVAAAADRKRFQEFDYCIACNLRPVKAGSDYCSKACAK